MNPFSHLLNVCSVRRGKHQSCGCFAVCALACGKFSVHNVFSNRCWTVFCGGGNAHLLGISSNFLSNSACRCVGLYPASAVVWELANSSVFWYSSCPLAFSWSRAAGACDKGNKPWVTVPLVVFCRKLYVCLAVTICLLMTSLSIFFLFPRSITVLPAGLNASSISFDVNTTSIYLNMTVSACSAFNQTDLKGSLLISRATSCRLADQWLADTSLVIPAISV